jgi:hypothetical protein
MIIIEGDGRYQVVTEEMPEALVKRALSALESPATPMMKARAVPDGGKE